MRAASEARVVGAFRPTWVDVVPALVASALGIASVLVPDPSVAYEFNAPPLPIGGLAAVATLPLVVRRPFPAASYTVELAAVTAIGLLHGPTGILPGVLAVSLAWAAFASSAAGAVIVLLLTMIAFAALAGAGAPYFDSPLALVTVVAFTTSWAVGLALRTWRESQRRTVADAEARRIGAERRAAEARDDERRTLARELHDSVSNSVTAVALQARALQEVDGPQLRQGLRAVERESRSALAELRRLLVLLRTANESGAWAMPPAVLVDVLESHRALGGMVEARIDPGLSKAPAAVRAALTPITGELLANARRHAPGAPVDLEVHLQQNGLRIEAENAVDAEVPARTDSFGLAGIRERVSQFGGRVEVPDVPGKFRVVICMPFRDQDG